jgi:hypothetical protein
VKNVVGPDVTHISNGDRWWLPENHRHANSKNDQRDAGNQHRDARFSHAQLTSESGESPI